MSDSPYKDGAKMLKSHIEIKKNPTGNYYFIFKNRHHFVAVSKSFETRIRLDEQLNFFKQSAKTAHVYEGDSNGDFPVFQVISIGANNYRFQFLSDKTLPILQSDLFTNRKQCLKFLNELKEQVEEAHILDL